MPDPCWSLAGSPRSRPPTFPRARRRLCRSAHEQALKQNSYSFLLSICNKGIFYRTFHTVAVSYRTQSATLTTWRCLEVANALRARSVILGQSTRYTCSSRGQLLANTLTDASVRRLFPWNKKKKKRQRMWQWILSRRRSMTALFYFTSPFDWSRKLVSSSQLIRCKTTTNHIGWSPAYSRAFILSFPLAPYSPWTLIDECDHLFVAQSKNKQTEARENATDQVAFGV